MLHSIYHRPLRLFWNIVSGVNNKIFFIMYATFLWTSFHNVIKICKSLVVYRFYCMALFHSQTRRHMINKSCEIKTFDLNEVQSSIVINCAGLKTRQSVALLIRVFTFLLQGTILTALFAIDNYVCGCDVLLWPEMCLS